MNDSERERVRLLAVPYHPPALRVGDRTDCLLRGAVVVTGWTDGPISWPRGRPVGQKRGHPSLLVEAELARAIRTESAAALRHWWGVSVGVVWGWRKALGVGRMNCQGSRLRMLAASALGAEALRDQPLSPEAR